MKTNTTTATTTTITTNNLADNIAENTHKWQRCRTWLRSKPGAHCCGAEHNGDTRAGAAHDAPQKEAQSARIPCVAAGACYKSVCQMGQPSFRICAATRTVQPTRVVFRRTANPGQASSMDKRQLLVKVFIVVGIALLVLCVQDSQAGSHQKKKKITIHVPMHKKIEKHVHTVVKHVHHHHKPVVIKEEKIIKEEHHPIKHVEHISHEHMHMHEEKHEHRHPEVEEEEEEHIHHHHNYEHKEESEYESNR